eukprot:11220786-Lingulodinium_polyedra.AAC.1
MPEERDGQLDVQLHDQLQQTRPSAWLPQGLGAYDTHGGNAKRGLRRLSQNGYGCVCMQA